VVESVATRLTHKGYVSLIYPTALVRFKRIEHIRCARVTGLEGCPNGLKSLFIEYGDSLKSLEPLFTCKELEILEINSYLSTQIADLSPLSACTKMKKLTVQRSGVTDLSPLSSMPLLEEANLSLASIKDIYPLSHCKKLTKLVYWLVYWKQ
jgi:Leucine-rich repeat (LRR) protein